MQLSKRLWTVASMVRETGCLADIGTDHGYIPIFLVQQEKIKSAIAMDVKEGPLARARDNIRLYGLEDKIETRRSDGLEKLKEGEADSIVMAGMGGLLTIRILKAGQSILKGIKEFILQPQSEISEVRRFLQEQEYQIIEENMVEEEGKYYPMMRVVHGKMEPWTQIEYLYGKYLLERKDPCLLAFLEQEERIYQTVEEHLKENKTLKAVQRQREIDNKICLIREAKKAIQS